MRLPVWKSEIQESGNLEIPKSGNPKIQDSENAEIWNPEKLRMKIRYAPQKSVRKVLIISSKFKSP